MMIKWHVNIYMEQYKKALIETKPCVQPPIDLIATVNQESEKMDYQWNSRIISKKYSWVMITSAFSYIHISMIKSLK